MNPVPKLLAATAVLLALPVMAQTTYRWVDKSGGVHYSDSPPPPEIREIQEKKLGNTNFVESGPSYLTTRAKQNFPVTFYRDAECKDFCKEARGLLDRRGVPYSEFTLKSNEDLEEFKRVFSVERPQIPALTVGTSKQVGFEQGIWNRLLDEAGYPKTVPPGGRGTGAAGGKPAPAGEPKG